MSKQGRILVVEDREEWRQTLVAALQRANFDAHAAENADIARQLLNTELYHVLILDIRLDEGDTSNIDGIKLLQELDQRHLTDFIQVIMLSSYGTKEQMRTAFRDYKVADFVFKQKFNGQAFLEDVQRVFKRNVLINLDLGIRWSQTSGCEPVVTNLKLNLESDKKNTRVQPGTALQKRAAIELDDLLRRLFYQAESILIKPMSPGRSGTGVIGVRPFYPNIGAGSPVVVKFGSSRKISQEYKNFKEFVEPLVGGKRCTGIHGIRRTALLGGIIYSFLGANDQLEDFGTFYYRSTPAQIKHALDQLFLNTCIDWYANASRLQLLDLTEDYQKVLHFTSEKLNNAFKQLCAIQQLDQDHLYFEALQHWKPFTNPLRTVAGRSLAYPTYTSPTHGDFNQHNLLVDKDGYIWMIDFQGTGQGHILRDIVGLDSVVRYQLLRAKDATLQERLEMEQALCSISHFSEVEQLLEKFQTDNVALAKAYAIAVHLRSLASHMVRQNHSDDFNEYYAALLYHALNTMRFMTLEKEQREHALLSASLLVDQLGLEKQDQ
jgi:DNA-binding response OmpR family regulator